MRSGPHTQRSQLLERDSGAQWSCFLELSSSTAVAANSSLMLPADKKLENERSCENGNYGRQKVSCTLCQRVRVEPLRLHPSARAWTALLPVSSFCRYLDAISKIGIFYTATYQQRLCNENTIALIRNDHYQAGPMHGSMVSMVTGLVIFIHTTNMVMARTRSSNRRTH